jgi:predicted phosphoribosyltransferase
MIFKDRFDAGKQLAKKLLNYKNNKDAVVLAIPRGGLQTGYAISKKLKLKLDIALTKKIGHPYEKEYAIGAVNLTSEVLDKDVIESENIPSEYIDNSIKEIRKELKDKYKLYLGREKPINLKGKIVIITDDGIATGKTMLATINLVKKEKPKKIIIAVPVGPTGGIDTLRANADEVFCLNIDPDFYAVSIYYEDFEQVEDEEAIKLLKEANKWMKNM